MQRLLILLLIGLTGSLDPCSGEEDVTFAETLDSPEEERSRLDPDFSRNISQLIESRGFGFEEHEVRTEDGYRLIHYRILHPKFAASNGSRGRPVILQHGLLSTGHDFIINAPGGHVDEVIDESKPPGNNLGFELAKRGYDVWLTNSRGNSYSRSHVFFHPDMGRTYWDFSFDQLIEFDLPATIDHVLRITGRQTVAYVGHSQGTMIAFGLMSQQARFNQILKPMIALAPVASLANLATPIRHLARIPFLYGVLNRMTGGEFLASGPVIQAIAKRLCSSRSRQVCANIMFLANGFSEAQLNASRVGVYASHYPAGTSVKNLAHFGQGVTSGRFAKFDYGGKKNEEVYGVATAPEYPLEKISNPDLALFSADNDWLASPADVNILIRRLGSNVALDYKVPVRDFNHLDFLIGREAGFMVNHRVIQLLRRYDDRP